MGQASLEILSAIDSITIRQLSEWGGDAMGTFLPEFQAFLQSPHKSAWQCLVRKTQRVGWVKWLAVLL